MVVSRDGRGRGSGDGGYILWLWGGDVVWCVWCGAAMWVFDYLGAQLLVQLEVADLALPPRVALHTRRARERRGGEGGGEGEKAVRRRER